jgi:hypothetical protein
VYQVKAKASGTGCFNPLMTTGKPRGFAYSVNGGDVAISHFGKAATVLRGARAQQFLAGVEDGDPQELMARATGNYKRGNEREARSQPRNRTR